MKTVQNLFLLYIRILAKIQLLKNRPTVIGITGSEGKTSTKRAVELVLKQRYKVKTSDKANSETGIPLDILGIYIDDYSMRSWLKIALLAPLKLLTNWERYNIYLVEMAIDSINEPKNMGYLLKVIKPHIGIITSISAVHGANYINALSDDEKMLSQEQIQEKILNVIAKEKGRIFTDNNRLKYAIFNIDNKHIERLSDSFNGDKITISKDSTKSPSIKVDYQENNGESFEAGYLVENEQYSFQIPGTLLGEEYTYTFASALAVARCLNIPIRHALHQLTLYRPGPGRFSVFNGINESLILDSSYNASPQSMRFAISKLDQIGKNRNARRIAVLGEMREIGESSEKEHKDLATFCIDKVDSFYLVGEEMKSHFISKLIESGLNKDQIKWFKNSRLLGESLKSEIQDKDLILIKGSQNKIFLEEAIKPILANPEDNSKLCRQSEWWMQEKEKWFKESDPAQTHPQ